MDYTLIQETIEDLEKDEATFFNCQNLAALYIVREYLKMSQKPGLTTVVEKELSDILPQYQNYKNLKRRYQMSEIAKEQVIKSIKEVCVEIREFITLLYRSTDMPEERDVLKQLLTTLYKDYGKTV